jgi:spore maturation protein CgeB
MRINLVGPFVVNAPFGTDIVFQKGLETLGHEVTACDPNIASISSLPVADFTVIFKSALGQEGQLKPSMGKVVVYQPDDIRFPHIKRMLVEISYYSESVLLFRDPDPADRSFLNGIGYSNVGYVPVTADPAVYYPMDVDKVYDFCFIGSMGGGPEHAHRHEMVSLLRQEGFNVAAGYANYDQARLIMNQSRVVLNHASEPVLGFGAGVGFQCRHFEAGFSGACLLSNEVLSKESELVSNFVRFKDRASFVSMAKWLIEDERSRYDMSIALHTEMFEKHLPEHRAKMMTDFLESL